RGDGTRARPRTHDPEPPGLRPDSRSPRAEPREPVVRARFALPEAISDPAHVRKRRRARGVELRAKPREMRLQPLGIGITLLGPTRAEERASFEHLARARHECGEKTELRRRQIERITVDARHMRFRIDA